MKEWEIKERSWFDNFFTNNSCRRQYNLCQNFCSRILLLTFKKYIGNKNVLTYLLSSCKNIYRKSHFDRRVTTYGHGGKMSSFI